MTKVTINFADVYQHKNAVLIDMDEKLSNEHRKEKGWR
jgi:hypothetical protein